MKKKNPIIGFLDESSICSDPNRRRVVNTRVVEYDGGRGKRSRTVFGFIALNGNDVVMVSEKAKKEDMLSFFELIRKENDDGRPILSVMDNAQIHRASIVGEKADRLDIHRTFLPPYSPDLQPIEFGWKDLKRELSGIPIFDQAVSAAKDMALQLFRERKGSYAKHWTETFINDKG